jgi:threonine 3-dehydrogenase
MQGRMKAVLKTKREPGFVIEEVDIPSVGPNDLLVKVRRAAICGTDSHIYAWDAWSQGRIKPPLIVGHEFCGNVVEVGLNVEGYKVGDYVSAESHIPCGYCYQCHNDQQHICGNLRILGVDTDGCFAEYAKIPQTVAWKNPPDMDPDVAAVQEPLGNSVYAVLAEEDVAGRAVAVFGCGSAGMFSTAVSHAAGAYPVISVIKHEFRRPIMEELGSNLVINVTKDDIVGAVMERTGGVGVDIVMEMTGNQTAIEQGLKIVRKGGRFTAFGIPSGPITIDLASLIFKGANLLGINGRLMYKTWTKMSAMLASGNLDPRPVMTHRFGMEDVAQAMEVMKSPKRECGKIVLTP